MKKSRLLAEGKVMLESENIYGPDVDPVRAPPQDRHGFPEAESLSALSIFDKRGRGPEARRREAEEQS